MKRKSFHILLSMLLVCSMMFGMTISVFASPAEPIYNGGLTDVFGYVESGAITLEANFTSLEGGELEYQWYSTRTNVMSDIRAIDGANGKTYTVPAVEGVQYICVAAWSVVDGEASTPTYSPLVKVEYQEAAKHEHDMQLVKVLVEATCTQTGELLLRCSICEYEEREYIDPEGHKWNYEKDVIFDGDDFKVPCSVCGTLHTAHEDLRVTVVQPGTCTDPEIVESVCEACGYKSQAYYEAPGHQLADPVRTEPSCEEDGAILTKCIVCDYEEKTVLPAIGHHYDDGTKVGADLVYTCLNCGKTNTEVHEHVFGTPTMTKEPACGVEGEAVQKCLECGFEETITTPALQHDWDEGVYQGNKFIYTCSRCKQTRTENHNHTFGAAVIKKQAVCMEEGQSVETCTVCGFEKITSIPALQHSWDDGKVQSDKLIYTCQLCGKTYSEKAPVKPTEAPTEEPTKPVETTTEEATSTEEATTEEATTEAESTEEVTTEAESTEESAEAVKTTAAVKTEDSTQKEQEDGVTDKETETAKETSTAANRNERGEKFKENSQMIIGVCAVLIGVLLSTVLALAIKLKFKR